MVTPNGPIPPGLSREDGGSSGIVREQPTQNCRWCREGQPEWSVDAKVWIHRRKRLDRRCSNPAYGTITTSEIVRPPAHLFYGDAYERGLDPFHPNCFEGFSDDIVEQIRAMNPGPQRAGWFLLDTWGHEIGFIPDGTVFGTHKPEATR